MNRKNVLQLAIHAAVLGLALHANPALALDKYDTPRITAPSAGSMVDYTQPLEVKLTPVAGVNTYRIVLNDGNMSGFIDELDKSYCENNPKTCQTVKVSGSLDAPLSTSAYTYPLSGKDGFVESGPSSFTLLPGRDYCLTARVANMKNSTITIKDYSNFSTQVCFSTTKEVVTLPKDNTSVETPKGNEPPKDATTSPPVEQSKGTTTPPVDQSKDTTTPPVDQSKDTTTPPVDQSKGTTTPPVDQSKGTTTPPAIGTVLVKQVELANALCTIPIKEFPPGTEPCGCFHAVLDPTNMTASVPALDAQTIDDIVGETGMVAILKASLQMLPGTMDWQPLSAQVIGISAKDQFDQCHANYMFVDPKTHLRYGPTLHLPYITVPVYTVLPTGQKIIASASVYDVTLKLEVKEEHQNVFRISDYKYLYSKTYVNPIVVTQ